MVVLRFSRNGERRSKPRLKRVDPGVADDGVPIALDRNARHRAVLAGDVAAVAVVPLDPAITRVLLRVHRLRRDPGADPVVQDARVVGGVIRDLIVIGSDVDALSNAWTQATGVVDAAVLNGGPGRGVAHMDALRVDVVDGERVEEGVVRAVEDHAFGPPAQHEAYEEHPRGVLHVEEVGAVGEDLARDDGLLGAADGDWRV